MGRIFVATHHTPVKAPLSDDDRLRQLGYAPQLVRRMGWFGNFAISFSVISILSGCMTLFGFGMGTGGPAVMFWGWIGVGGMVMLVGLGLAEVTSAYPTAGGLFYMAGRLAPPKHAAAWSWYTGWLNLLGLIGAIAGIDFGAAQFIGALASLQWSYVPTPRGLIGIYACILLMHALLNLRGIRMVNILNSVSVWWHLLGVAVIVAVITIVPSHHQTVGFVFTHVVNTTGFRSGIYAGAVGLLLAGYTFSGYDASCHLSEETSKADFSAPRGIIRAIGVSWIAGAVLLGGLLFAIQDYNGEAGSATGVPPAQIFLDSIGSTGAKLLMLVVILAQLFCGNAETAACSRMVFAFAGRDNALPGRSLWQRVNRFAVPSAAVWLSVVVAFLLALPYLWNPAAYGAVTAINVVGITPAYIIPVYLRVRQGRNFEAGPWNLGRWGVPIGIMATIWVVAETILFCLPQASPITAKNFNYAPIALAAALLLAGIWWLVAGRRSYVTPTTRGASQQFAYIEEEIV
jgi:amino acid transporter